jgi:hypothetical protein
MTSSTRRVTQWPWTNKMTTPVYTWDRARDAELLEVVTIGRDDGSELAIHAMKMRRKYRRLLSGD